MLKKLRNREITGFICSRCEQQVPLTRVEVACGTQVSLGNDDSVIESVVSAP
jgi:hypothetical protein